MTGKSFLLDSLVFLEIFSCLPSYTGLYIVVFSFYFLIHVILFTHFVVDIAGPMNFYKVHLLLMFGHRLNGHNYCCV